MVVHSLEVQVPYFFQHAAPLPTSLSLKIRIRTNLKFVSITPDAQFEREVSAKVMQKMPRDHSLLSAQ